MSWKLRLNCTTHIFKDCEVCAPAVTCHKVQIIAKQGRSKEMCVCVSGLCVRQVSQRCVRRPQEPVFLLHGRLSAAALQVDQRLGL